MTDKSIKVDIQECVAADSISSLFISQFKEDNSEYYKTADTNKETAHTNKEKQDKSTETKSVAKRENHTISIPAGNKKKSVRDCVGSIISKAQEYYPKEFMDTASECRKYMKKQTPYPYYFYEKDIIVFDINHRRFRRMDMRGAIYTLESYYGIEVKASYQSQYFAEKIVREICLKSMNVSYFGNIAGYSGGAYETLGGEWVLVPRTIPILKELPYIQHEKGTPLYWDKWKPLYDNIFYPMFVQGKDKSQLDYVFKWLAGARAYVSGRTPLKMPCLQIYGDACAGKTLFGDICNNLLTGQAKDPSSYIYGDTRFNSHLIADTLLLIDDETMDKSKHVNRIKKMLVANGVQVKEKNIAQEPVLYPRQVIMILTNNDKLSKNALIPICSDTIDKVSLLKTMGKVTEMEWETRERMIEEALPYFAAYLDYEVYPTLSHKGRMIVPAWQYSEAVKIIFEGTAAGQLWHHLTTMLEHCEGCSSLYDRPMKASEWMRYLSDYNNSFLSKKYAVPCREQIGKMLRELAKMDELKGCIEVGKRKDNGTYYTIHRIAKTKE